MRLFRQLLGKPHRIPGQAHFPTNYDGTGCWWNDDDVVPLAAGRGFNVAVVGEGQWQDSIAAIVGGRCEEGHNCHFPAQLVLDNSQHDQHAVGVMIDYRAVGWLPAELSAHVRAALRRLNPHGRPVTCKAKIIGGWDHGLSDRGYFGVKLSLSLPLKLHEVVTRPRQKLGRSPRPMGSTSGVHQKRQGRDRECLAPVLSKHHPTKAEDAPPADQGRPMAADKMRLSRREAT